MRRLFWVALGRRSAGVFAVRQVTKAARGLHARGRRARPSDVADGLRELADAVREAHDSSVEDELRLALGIDTGTAQRRWAPTTRVARTPEEARALLLDPTGERAR